MASKTVLALRSLSALAVLRLAVGEHDENTTYKPYDLPSTVNDFDLQVESSSWCGEQVKGVYRFKGHSPAGPPFFLRAGVNDSRAGVMEEEMFLFYAPCEAPAWFFATSLPESEMMTDFCNGVASTSLSLPMSNAWMLSTADAAMWVSAACEGETWLSIKPVHPDVDDMVMTGFHCRRELGGIWKVDPKTRYARRPTYFMESFGGTFVLMYREDLHHCGDQNNRWSIWNTRDLAEEHDHSDDHCHPVAWSDVMYEWRPQNDWWIEECESGASWAWVSSFSRTRTSMETSCPDDLVAYIGNVICYHNDPDASCPYHCDRLLRVVEDLCTSEDLQWSWYSGEDGNETSEGAVAPIVDIFDAMKRSCEPSAECYSRVSELWNWEWEHCWEELCVDEDVAWDDSFNCMDKYYSARCACERTEANIDFRGETENAYNVLASKFWCYEGEGHHEGGGKCITLPRELADYINAVRC